MKVLVLVLQSSDLVLLLLHEKLEAAQLLLVHLLEPVDAALVGLLQLRLHVSHLLFVDLGRLKMVRGQSQELLAVLLRLLLEILVGVVLLGDH